jgi:hypothetical protein
MFVVSTLLSILLPKQKKSAAPDATSVNVQSGSPLTRVFGTAVVGGTVVDSTTPKLQNSGGKGGALGGGKNQSQEIKTGSFLAMLGEGERPWNSIMRDTNQGLFNFVVSKGAGKEELFGKKDAFLKPNSTYNPSIFQVTVEDTIGSPNNLKIDFDSTVPLDIYNYGSPLNNFYALISSPTWIIPASKLNTLTTISYSHDISYVMTNARSPDIQISLGLIQDGFLFFNPSASAYSLNGGDIGTGFLSRGSASILPTNLNSKVALSDNFLNSTTGTVNLTSGGNIEMCYVFQFTDAGLGGVRPPLLCHFQIKNQIVSYRAQKSSNGELALKKIWMNDQLWYDSTSTDDNQIQKNSERLPYFTFYSGSLSQSQDPTFVALRGADKMPGYQGYSYVVYNNLPLNDWGNNYPASKYLVESSLLATPENIVEDVMYRSGAMYNKPLLEGKDWAWATNADTGARLVSAATYDGVVIDGYTISFDSNDLKRVWNELGQIFRIAVVSNPTLAYEQAPQRGFNQLNPPMYKVVPLVNERTIDVEAINLGVEDSSQELPWPTGLEEKKSEEIPGSVEVQFYNNNKTGERESVSVDRSTYQIAGTYTFASNYFANRREATANSIANFILFQGLERARQLNSAVLPNTLLGMQTLVKWKDFAGNETLSLRPQKIVLGANGKTEIVGISTNPAPPSGTIPTDGIADGSVPLYVSSAPDILWIEGYAFTTPASGNKNVVNVWSVNKFNSPVSDISSVLISADNGASFSTTTLNSIASNAQRIKIVAFVPSTRKEYRFYEIDRGTHIDVDVGQYLTLNSVDEAFLYDATKNIVYIEGVGVVGFATTTLIGTGKYRLTNLLFNLGQSGLDSVTPPQAWSVPAEATLFLGAPYELPVPSSFNQGSSITLSAVTATASSGNLTKVFRKANAAPRPPLLRHIQFTAADKSVEVAWSPSVSQTTLIVPDLFNDPLQSAPESYTIKFWEGVILRRTFSGITARFVSYSEAQQALDGVISRAALEVEIIQEGNVATLQQAPKISLITGLLV